MVATATSPKPPGCASTSATVQPIDTAQRRPREADHTRHSHGQRYRSTAGHGFFNLWGSMARHRMAPFAAGACPGGTRNISHRLTHTLRRQTPWPTSARSICMPPAGKGRTASIDLHFDSTMAAHRWPRRSWTDRAKHVDGTGPAQHHDTRLSKQRLGRRCLASRCWTYLSLKRHLLFRSRSSLVAQYSAALLSHHDVL